MGSGRAMGFLSASLCAVTIRPALMLIVYKSARLINSP